MLDTKHRLIFQFGIISIMSCKKNEMLEISLDFLKDLFLKLSPCSFIMFVFFNHNSSNIKINSKDYQVYKNFLEVFQTLSPSFLNIQIL